MMRSMKLTWFNKRNNKTMETVIGKSKFQDHRPENIHLPQEEEDYSTKKPHTRISPGGLHSFS